jgi:hypothetical protein
MEIPEQAKISRSFAKYFLVEQWAKNCIKLRKATRAAQKKMVEKWRNLTKTAPKKSSKSDRSIGNVKMCGKNQKSLEGVNDFRKKSVKMQTWKHAIQSRPEKTKKTKKQNSKTHSKSKKTQKAKFQPKSYQNIRPGLVWARAAPKPAQNQKIEKIEKSIFFARPSSTRRRWHSPLPPGGTLPTGGHSVEAPAGSAPSAAKCFFTLFFLLVFWFLFYSCHSLLALVNPF